MVLKNGARECVDFRKGSSLPAQRMPSDRGGFDAGADGEVTDHGRLVKYLQAIALAGIGLSHLPDMALALEQQNRLICT